MNKCTASALAAEAAAGARVLIVSHSVIAARQAFHDFDELAESVGAEVRRANGAQRLTFPSGGRVHFTSARATGGRGLAVDVVFVDWDVETELSVDELKRFYDDITPCLATSTRHEIIRA